MRSKISPGPFPVSFREPQTTRSQSQSQSQSSQSEEMPESMQDRIVRITADLREICNFYNFESSLDQHDRLAEFYVTELKALPEHLFDSYSQEEKVDYLLLRNYLSRCQRNLALDRKREAELGRIVEPWACWIEVWCGIRRRQGGDDVLEPRKFASSLAKMRTEVDLRTSYVTVCGHKIPQATGVRAIRRIRELRGHLDEMCGFYSGYHPSFDYWVGAPKKALDAVLDTLEADVGRFIVRGGEKTIVGEPIGRDGLLVELEAEMIPYSPEELMEIAEREFTWCEEEMKKAAARLGVSEEDWRQALERVKNQYEPPETHTSFVRSLVAEGAGYVKRHDLVTVPRLAEEAITMTRIPPEQQLVSPFFLGGRRLQVSYPRADMEQEDKLMTLRGNNRHFSRATAFHEMIPGHRLQVFVGDRSRPYRAKLFDTPFYVEGWALYWEMLLWDRGDFFVTPEDKIGSLFWRMHRCGRILFSLGFHLGKMSAEECVELLVRRVGHEKSTAEGEVRRSLNGTYSPLYQAGYMLGALQLMRLRQEAIMTTRFTEKAFHDRVLRANVMPIEMLRALILGKELKEDFKSSWKFYGDVI
ncbi:hypothetical protein GGR50DRAFT_224674 [Xylaria sp. CBS 124048]|nr:hypothetical protein GGR50DRAFT_224674 [Xylaria sp. CBS 124048]